MNKRDKLYFRLKENMSNIILSKLYKFSKNIMKNNEVAKHFNIHIDYLTNKWWNITHLLIYSYNNLISIIELALFVEFKPIAISNTIPTFNFSNGTNVQVYI
jgi:hypothetical protein